MHSSSTLGLLAFVATASVHSAAASSQQAVIHIEVDGVDAADSFDGFEAYNGNEAVSEVKSDYIEADLMDYFTDSIMQLNKTQADAVCAKGNLPSLPP
jgi:hypothetical protein